MYRKNKQNGFTIIEITLAMGFVAVLLLAISMIIIQMGNIYNKGITIKEVNQVGQSLSSNLQNTIELNAPFSVSAVGTDKGNYLTLDYNGKLDTATTDPAGGRLCLGQYSYVWNYGNHPGPDTNTANKYNIPGKQLRFIKVADSNSSYCKELSPGSNTFSDIIYTDAIELLVADREQLDLAIYDFSISSAATAIDVRTGQQLYSIQFTLGTNNGSALTATGCSPTSAPASDPDPNFCSINRFSLVVRAGNISK